MVKMQPTLESDLQRKFVKIFLIVEWMWLQTGNHVWDQKETMSHIEKENRLLRPKNLFEPSPGKGFGVFTAKNGMKVGVLNLMGNVFMKKSEDVFEAAEKFTKKYKLKEDYDFLLVDFHGEITSEKAAMGHFFDGKATLVIGTHTHIPTNDTRVLRGGTAYQTDAGMCGDYDSVIGMNKDNSINRFLKKKSSKHFPAIGEASLCGVIVECDVETGLNQNSNQICLLNHLQRRTQYHSKKQKNLYHYAFANFYV